MTGVIPAFWAKYRGSVDPQIPNDTEYIYRAWFWYSTGGPPEFGEVPTVGYGPLEFTVLGPPQLTKERYIELNWTVPPGVIAIQINLESPFTDPDARYYTSNAAEGGTRDEGRYNILGSGVLQQ